jgi:hypothetical protein
MEILVDRGDVSTADGDYHYIRVRLPETATLEDALTAVTRRGFPGFRSWLVCAGLDGSRPLAAIRTGRSLSFVGYVAYVTYIADQNARLRDLIGEPAGVPVYPADVALFYFPRDDRDPDEVRSEHLAEAHLPLTEQVLQLHMETPSAGVDGAPR